MNCLQISKAIEAESWFLQQISLYQLSFCRETAADRNLYILNNSSQDWRQSVAEKVNVGLVLS